MKITQKNVIESQDWDYLVRETYKKPYCLQQQNGCQDRGVYALTVPYIYQTDYDAETIPEIVNGEEMGVKFASWLARDPKQPLKTDKDAYGTQITGAQWEIDLWWERNFYPEINVVANDLHAKGLLPAGEYLINFHW